MEKARTHDRPSNDQRTSDRRREQDPLHAGEERRKGERRKNPA